MWAKLWIISIRASSPQAEGRIDTRRLSNNWLVCCDNRFLWIERQSRHPPARSTVLVYEAADGQMEIRDRERVRRVARNCPRQPARQTDKVAAGMATIAAISRGRSRPVAHLEHLIFDALLRTGTARAR